MRVNKQITVGAAAVLVALLSAACAGQDSAPPQLSTAQSGLPIIESVNVTDGIVAFIGDGSMAFGSEHAPTFEESSDATMHFETSPTALSATGTPNTVAAPIISLFQQDLLGIKMTLGLDWRVTRQGGTQILTGAGGW